MSVPPALGFKQIREATKLVNDALINFLDGHRPGQPHIIQLELIGSLAILGEGADIDILAYAPAISNDPELARGLWHVLVESGDWDSPIDNPYTDNDLMSYRNGDVNLILCMDEQGFKDRVTGRDVCTYLESKVPGLMKDKTLRVDVHRIIRGQTVSV